MKILVIGGMYGNEPLGLDVVKLLQQKPVSNVDAVFANEEAIAGNCRFIDKDLNRVFPGKIQSNTYETRRADQLLSLCANFDFVLDFHNTHSSKNDCAFIGAGATETAYDLADWLGLSRIVVADYDCINKYAPNCLSVEISLESQLMNSSYWYTLIAKLATLNKLPRHKKIEKYRFVYRITIVDKIRFGLDEYKLRAFEAIDLRLAKDMNIKAPAYPIFIKDAYTPYNYGGLLNKIK